MTSSDKSQVHASESQTKILERVTKDEMRVLDALFKGLSTRFGLRNDERWSEKALWNVGSALQNLRLGA